MPQIKFGRWVDTRVPVGPSEHSIYIYMNHGHLNSMEPRYVLEYLR